MTPTLALPTWMLTPEQLAERDRILSSQYFLVRMAGNGDVWKCRRCGGRHTFITLNCVEQPFPGTYGGLYAYYRTVGLTGAEQFLSPIQKDRYARIARLLDLDHDLSESHPETARKIATPEHDWDVGRVSLGLLEPITRKQALDRARAINARGIQPRFTLPGLEREE